MRNFFKTFKQMPYLKSFYSEGRLHIYSVLLLVSTFLWMALPFNSGPDMNIQKWVGAIQMILPDRQKPSTDEILFIDISKSRYLVPSDDDSIENDVITNRKYLAELFTLLAENNNQVKYVLCDVNFDLPTPDDDLLIEAVSGLKEKFLTIDTYTKDELRKNLLTQLAVASCKNAKKPKKIKSFCSVLVKFLSLSLIFQEIYFAIY